MSNIDLGEVATFLVDVAKQAGDVITAARPTTTAAGEKKNSVDLVTETDQYVVHIPIQHMHIYTRHSPSDRRTGSNCGHSFPTPKTCLL